MDKEVRGREYSFVAPVFQDCPQLAAQADLQQHVEVLPVPERSIEPGANGRTSRNVGKAMVMMTMMMMVMMMIMIVVTVLLMMVMGIMMMMIVMVMVIMMVLLFPVAPPADKRRRGLQQNFLLREDVLLLARVHDMLLLQTLQCVSSFVLDILHLRFAKFSQLHDIIMVTAQRGI